MKTFLLIIMLIGSVSYVSAGSLTLQDCLQLAGQNNPELRSARLTPEVAGTLLSEAQSGYLPRVDVDAGYTILKDAQAVIVAGRTEPTQEDRYPFFNLRVDQTLSDFGYTRGKVEQATALAAAADEEFRAQLQDVLLKTVVAYFRVLEAQQLQVAAGDEVTTVADHLRVANELFDQGVVTRNDVLQAEVELADSRQRQLSRDNDLENAWLQLNYLLGRDADQRDELQESWIEPQATIAAAELPQALAGHPLIRAGQRRLEASQAEVVTKKSAYRPSLYAEGRVNYLDNRYVEEQTVYAATVGLKINLFDGNAKRSRLSAALTRAEQDRQQLQALTRQAELAYHVAANDSRVAAQRIETTHEAIRQAEENLRINRDRYQAQVGTATEVLDAQTLLTRSRTEHYQSQYDYQVALARLQRVLGRLGESL